MDIREYGTCIDNLSVSTLNLRFPLIIFVDGMETVYEKCIAALAKLKQNINRNNEIRNWYDEKWTKTFNTP